MPRGWESHGWDCGEDRRQGCDPRGPVPALIHESTEGQRREHPTSGSPEPPIPLTSTPGASRGMEHVPPWTDGHPQTG